MAVYKKVPGCETVNISTLEFDETPTPGSLNPVTSGGVAGSVAQQSSNIAPNYTKKTYEANSYVMQDGVLYTNPNAIGTAEDWNPAHWTQTTVAEMMANAVPSWTHTNTTESISGGQTRDLTVDDRVFVDLTATRRPPTSNPAKLRLFLNGECIVALDKTTGVRVETYIGSNPSAPTTNISTGSTAISLSDSGVAVKALLQYYAGHLILTPIV